MRISDWSSDVCSSDLTGGVIEFRTIDAGDYLAEDETVGAKVGTGYQTANRETLGTFTGFATPVEGLDMVASVAKRDSGSIELGHGIEQTNSGAHIVTGPSHNSYNFSHPHHTQRP